MKIPTAYVAWRAGTTNLFLLGFLAPIDCLPDMYPLFLLKSLSKKKFLFSMLNLYFRHVFFAHCIPKVNYVTSKNKILYLSSLFYALSRNKRTREDVSSLGR